MAPQFPDYPPGETVGLQGWLSFYAGDNIEAEFKRIDRTGWRDQGPRQTEEPLLDDASSALIGDVVHDRRSSVGLLLIAGFTFTAWQAPMDR